MNIRKINQSPGLVPLHNSFPQLKRAGYIFVKCIRPFLVEYDLTRYEIPVRQWALQDAVAARAVKKVNRIRLDFISGAFAELGFTGDDLDMRSMLFTCYHTWEAPMFREIPRKRRRALIAKRIELLIGR